MPSRFTFPAGLARAAGGAILFSLPLLMTMEMWEFGFTIDRLRLALLLLANVPLLTGLSFYAGFEDTFSWREDTMDGLAAYALSFLTSAVILAVFGLIDISMPAREILGKISLQAVPASIGAVLARSQLGNKSPHEKARERETGYGGELFHMLTGALFLAFNVAPTEEMMVISHKMDAWHALILIGLSLAIMHGFIYAADFRGHVPLPEGVPSRRAFLHFTIAGYAIALVVSAAMLWTFGRLSGLAPDAAVRAVIVLAFPSAMGAAAARLIL